MRQDLIDGYRRADAAYQDLLQRADAAKRERDRLVLEAHDAGTSIRQIAKAIELSPARVQQMIGRAKASVEGEQQR